jgi:outer membrane receptor protein involved in Fe transport
LGQPSTSAPCPSPRWSSSSTALQRETATNSNARLFSPAARRGAHRGAQGAVSALYGSASLGGVINVITKKGRISQDPTLTGEVSQAFPPTPRGVTSTAARLQSETLWVRPRRPARPRRLPRAATPRT